MIEIIHSELTSNATKVIVLLTPIFMVIGLLLILALFTKNLSRDISPLRLLIGKVGKVAGALLGFIMIYHAVSEAVYHVDLKYDYVSEGLVYEKVIVADAILLEGNDYEHYLLITQNNEKYYLDEKLYKEAKSRIGQEISVGIFANRTPLEMNIPINESMAAQDYNSPIKEVFSIRIGGEE